MKGQIVRVRSTNRPIYLTWPHPYPQSCVADRDGHGQDPRSYVPLQQVHQTLDVAGIQRKTYVAGKQRKSYVAGIQKKSYIAGIQRKSYVAGIQRKRKSHVAAIQKKILICCWNTEKFFKL